MLKGKQIFILEDEIYFQRMLTRFLENQGAEVSSAHSIEEARNLLKGTSYDYALLDVNLPDGNSLDLLRTKEVNTAIGIVIMTAEGGVETAVEAIKLGASDYLSKPFDPEELPLVFNRIGQQITQKRIDSHREKSATTNANSLFLGKRLGQVEAMIARIVEADARLSDALPPVLIQGETGSGKSTIARWIHERGPRANSPLVEINCSTLTESLAEAEWFGHEKGSFTDAKSTKIGLFEAAEGGTLFLDEISSLPLPIQTKLLTAIEDQSIRRVGGNRSIRINVRIIGASIEPLNKLVAEGLFREDLFHRLDLLKLTIPPIRDFPDDLPPLASHLTSLLEKKYRLDKLKLSQQAKKTITDYPWPGNVRELAHELERSIIFREGDELNINIPLNPKANKTFSSDLVNPNWEFSDDFNLESEVEKLTKDLINKALKKTNNNVSAAARILGVSRDYIRYRI